MSRLSLTVIYFACLAFIVLVGLGYEALSPGLAARSGDGVFYCRELMSSGGGDDVMVVAFVLLLIPLILRAFRINRGVAAYEVVALCTCVTLVAFNLGVASLDCAEILYTAFIVPDPLLAGTLISLPTAVVVLACLRAGP